MRIFIDGINDFGFTQCQGQGKASSRGDGDSSFLFHLFEQLQVDFSIFHIAGKGDLFHLALSGLGGVPYHFQNVLQAATSGPSNGLVLVYQIQNNFYVLLYFFDQCFG